MHISPYDAGSYNTAGASWKSNMTPSARPQIAGQSASDESSCMAHTFMPTDLAECMPDQQIFEHGALPRLDPEARCSQQIHVRLVFADVAGIIDTDHFIEVVEKCQHASSPALSASAAAIWQRQVSLHSLSIERDIHVHTVWLRPLWHT